jgi:hypothetical protein
MREFLPIVLTGTVGSVLKVGQVTQIWGLCTFFTVQVKYVHINFGKTSATVLAMLSQTNLVTLSLSQKQRRN